MKNKTIRNIIRLFLLLAIVLIVFGGSYTWWNATSPDKTCASCHEINPSHQSWSQSAHSEISCFKCHGTALENGWHSLSEKAAMVGKQTAEKALAAGITEVVFDRNGYLYHGRVKQLADAARKGGLKF